MTVRLSLFEFWKMKEAELGKIISIREVSIELGISRATLGAYRNNDVKRPDLEIIGKLCAYFNVPPGPVPFLIYVSDDE